MKKKIKNDVKEEIVKENYSTIDPIDRLPEIDFDETEIIGLLCEEKERIDSFRSEWFERKFEYLRQWDDYLDYDNFEIIEGQKNIHIPVTHEKIQALHARLYKATFAIDPIFSLEPLNLSTRDEVIATKEVLRWYLRNEINYRQGLKPFVDELFWDLCTDGWAVGYKRWETIERKIVDLKKIDHDEAKAQMLEAFGDLKRKNKISKNYEEIERIARIYSGVILETVPQESVYFPDYIPTSGNLNHPPLIMIEREMDEETILSQKNRGFYNPRSADIVIERGRGQDVRKAELKKERERMAGLYTYNENKGFQVFTCFLRKDLKGDGYPQEYIFTASLKAKKILRATYLDRVCRDGNRPAYKFDLLKRPRSAYSRGMVELLYPLNKEIDEFHNFRRAAGAIANMPWGFYRASSGLEKEAIKVKPGVFFPVDDPTTDVRPITFGNVTSWALQEESLAQNYADKITSMPAMMSGQVPQMVGPLRSTSGVNALLTEASAPLDVYLDRIRIPMGQLIGGVLSDIQTRLPDSIKIMVLGEKGELLFDPKGMAMNATVPKSLIMGNYKFSLAANDAQYNPEKDRQNAMTLLQMGTSQLPVQMGITTPENVYWLFRDAYEKNGVRDMDRYLTKPQMAPHASNLFQEYTTCLNGKMPVIVLNDDHKAKIEGLTLLAQSPEFQEAKQRGVASPISELLLMQAIKAHMEFQKTIEGLEQMRNQSGMEIPVTTGARSTGINPGGQNERQPGTGEPASTRGVDNSGQAGEAAQA